MRFNFNGVNPSLRLRRLLNTAKTSTIRLNSPIQQLQKQYRFFSNSNKKIDDSILPVLIVGAGPVGLVLSLLLTKLGICVCRCLYVLISVWAQLHDSIYLSVPILTVVLCICVIKHPKNIEKSCSVSYITFRHFLIDLVMLYSFI